MATTRDLALFCLGAVFVGVGLVGSRVSGDPRRDDHEAMPRDAEREALVREADQPFARIFRRVAAFARPSVAFVEARHAAPLNPGSDFSPGPADDTRPDDTLRRFFMSPLRFEGEGQAARAVTSGTGVIAGRDGIVLTNAHLIASRAGASHLEVPDVRVKLDDGRWFSAIVLGCEPRADLAVLELCGGPADLVPALLDDADHVERGDWVLALGNSFGREPTASLGIVCAKGRGGLEPRFEDFLQTDASINPGNSGGPLVDVKGTTVGINLGLAWTGGSSTGVGFAIPSSSALLLERRIHEIASVASGALGLSVRESMPSELAGERGLVVVGVKAGGSAEKAGLHAGDALLGLTGSELAETARAGRRISARRWSEGTVSSIELEPASAAVARER
jgi:S1-C subfamily serine protease